MLLSNLAVNIYFKIRILLYRKNNRLPTAAHIPAPPNQPSGRTVFMDKAAGGALREAL
jgi:hypothetical protein